MRSIDRSLEISRSLFRSSRFHRLVVASVILGCSGGDKTGPTEPAVTPVSSVSVTVPRSNIRVGESIQAAALTLDASGSVLTGRQVVWTSSDANVATVTGGGLVTAAAPGSTTLSAASEGKTGSAVVAVTVVPVASLSIEPTTASLIVGMTVTLSAIAKDSAGGTLTGRPVAWASSNPSIATVSASGVVTGLAEGPVDITASVEGKVATGKVGVGLVPVAAVAVTGVPTPLYVNRTAQLAVVLTDASGNTLSGRSVQWQSSNTSIATVSASGVITTLAAGTVMISASSEGKIGTTQTTITIAPVGSISLSPDSAIILAGTTQQLSATIRDVDGIIVTDRAVAWAAEAGKASVTSSGVVTALIPAGQFTVTATAEGKLATAKFNAVTFFRLIAGGGHTCGATETGETYCWGANNSGQLGIGSFLSKLTPQPVLTPLAFAALAAGGSHTCGIAFNGPSSCWGLNEAGQLGNGALGQFTIPGGPPKTEPVTIVGGQDYVALSAGFSHTCGIASNALAFCWGNGYSGQLGTGKKAEFNSDVGGPIYQESAPQAVLGGLTFSGIVAGGSHTCAITAAGLAYCWGSNTYGQLGDGTLVDRLTPTAVNFGFSFTTLRLGLDHTCGLLADGRAFCWGRNQFGQVGNGNPPTTNVTSPSSVATSLRFTVMAAGDNHTCALTSEGAAYCWGLNTDGQLGIGSTANQPFPTTRVGGGLLFTGIRAGGQHTCALAAGTGAAFCWGLNSSGQLGDGTMTSRQVPVLVRGY